jgi:MFS family permease
MENNLDNTIPILTLDEALEKNPIGFYQYRLLLLCGLAFMTDALEVNLLSFLSVCAGKEWNLSSGQEASITGIVFAGIIVGSGFWGILSDKYGRKKSFIVATALISLGGLLTGFASSFPLLLFYRAICGFGIGGANVPFDLLAELLPASQRGSFLVYIEYFWTFGSILVAGLAWGVLSEDGWRVLSLLTVIPVALTSFFSAFYLPESPRWLLEVGRNQEAEQILIDAAKANGITMPPFKLRGDIPHHQQNVDYLAIVKNKKLRKVTFPLWAVWAGFGCTYYGMILFVTRLYDTSSDDDDSDTCTFDYSAIFYNALSEIAAVTFNGLVLESVGRVKMQVYFYLLAGFTVLMMGISMPGGALIAVAFIGRIAIMIASVRQIPLHNIFILFCFLVSLSGMFVCLLFVISYFCLLIFFTPIRPSIHFRFVDSSKITKEWTDGLE